MRYVVCCDYIQQLQSNLIIHVRSHLCHQINVNPMFTLFWSPPPVYFKCTQDSNIERNKTDAHVKAY